MANLTVNAFAVNPEIEKGPYKIYNHNERKNTNAPPRRQRASGERIDAQFNLKYPKPKLAITQNVAYVSIYDHHCDMKLLEKIHTH